MHLKRFCIGKKLQQEICANLLLEIPSTCISKEKALQPLPFSSRLPPTSHHHLESMKWPTSDTTPTSTAVDNPAISLSVGAPNK